MPVRGSKRVLETLPEIASVASRVFIQATEVEFKEKELPRNVKVFYDVEGLSLKRQRGLEIAEEEGEEFSFQIDDDLAADFVNCLLHLENTLLQNPWLGSASTMPRLLAYYASQKPPSNMDFDLIPSPTQFWGMRISAYAELQQGFRIMRTTNALEDVYVGLDLWKHGYANATLPSLKHDHKRARLNPKRSAGGMPPAERDKGMEEAVRILKEEFQGNILKGATLQTTKKGTLKFSPRYNWSEMASRVKLRWGAVGYKDHRMAI